MGTFARGWTARGSELFQFQDLPVEGKGAEVRSSEILLGRYRQATRVSDAPVTRW